MNWWRLLWLVPIVTLAEVSAPAAAFSPQWKLRHLVVPAVNFRDADPRRVVEYLQYQSGQLSTDKEPLNIVWLTPATDRLPRITLNLTDIPLGEALKYVTRAAGLRYRVDAHAVVIERRPRAAAGEHAPAR